MKITIDTGLKTVTLHGSVKYVELQELMWALGEDTKDYKIEGNNQSCDKNPFPLGTPNTTSPDVHVPFSRAENVKTVILPYRSSSSHSITTSGTLQVAGDEIIGHS